MYTLSELQYLSLLKSGLWGTNVDSDGLFDNRNWKDIYKMSKKQTTIGIVYDGISKLNNELRPSKKVLITWFSKLMQIEKANDSLNKRLVDIVEKYVANGLHPVLLKGQGLGQYYLHPLHRQPGDIDLFFFDGYEKANSVAKNLEDVEFVPETTYHQGFFYKDAEVENHLVYVDFYNSKNKKAWQHIQELVPLAGKEKLRIGDFEVDVPSPQMNVLYVFLHLMHHFLQVGVGMRQVCDWVCLWNAKHDEIDKDLFLRCVDLLHVRRPMVALTYIVTTYLGLPKGYIPLDCSSEQAKKDGEFMLRDILNMGNFGHEQNIFEGFDRNHHLRNLRTYAKFLKRYVRLYAFYPSEVRAYPWVWLKSKF